MALNFRDTCVEVSLIDAQPSADNGVIVLVLGKLERPQQPQRRFAQTFFLAAEGDRKFFLQNDIFRYLNEGEENEPAAASFRPNNGSGSASVPAHPPAHPAASAPVTSRVASPDRASAAVPPAASASATTLGSLEVDGRGADSERMRSQERRKQRHASDAFKMQRVSVDVELQAQLPAATFCYCCNRAIDPGCSALVPECLHAICRSCYDGQLARRDQPFVCPVCLTAVPANLLQATPERHPVVELLVAGNAKEVRCGLCDAEIPASDAQATWTCTACEKGLCDLHAALHRKTPTLTAHPLVALTTSGVQTECATHGEPIKAVCWPCNELVCLACFASTHMPGARRTGGSDDGQTDHQTHLLTAAFLAGCRERLEQALSKADHALGDCIDRVADTRLGAAEVASRDVSVSATIKSTFSMMHALLDARSSEVLGQVASSSAEERAALQTLEDSARQRHAVFASTAAMARLVMSEHGRTAGNLIAQLEPRLTARLHALAADAPVAEIPLLRAVVFEADPALEGRLRSAGVLSISSGPAVSVPA